MVIRMFGKRNEIKCEKRGDLKYSRQGNFTRVFKLFRHGLETSNADSLAIINNEISIHPREQLDIELWRYKALIILQKNMIR